MILLKYRVKLESWICKYMYVKMVLHVISGWHVIDYWSIYLLTYHYFITIIYLLLLLLSYIYLFIKADWVTCSYNIRVHLFNHSRLLIPGECFCQECMREEASTLPFLMSNARRGPVLVPFLHIYVFGLTPKSIPLLRHIKITFLPQSDQRGTFCVLFIINILK